MTTEPYLPFDEVHDVYWQSGTRWLSGLAEADIAAVETRWGWRFPPEYRLFLSRLHAPDRPLGGIERDERGQLRFFSTPSFYHWQTDNAAIEDATEALVDGLLWEVAQGQTWHPSWGQRPATVATQQVRLQEVMQLAPSLIPIFHRNRYLLAEPCEEGNPVLSIHQSDVIILSANFRDYLIHELLDLIEPTWAWKLTPQITERYQLTPINPKDYHTIPFWGEFLVTDHRS